ERRMREHMGFRITDKRRNAARILKGGGRGEEKERISRPATTQTPASESGGYKSAKRGIIRRRTRLPLCEVLRLGRRWACLRWWIRLRVREGSRPRREKKERTQVQNRHLRHPQDAGKRKARIRAPKPNLGRPPYEDERRIRWGLADRYQRCRRQRGFRQHGR